MHDETTIHIIDDDLAIRDAITKLVNSVGMKSSSYSSAEEFLNDFNCHIRGCIVLDVRMNGMGGLELQKELNNREILIPIIFITGHGDIPMTVDALKGGAVNFIEKPFRNQQLLESIQAALKIDERIQANNQVIGHLVKGYSELTEREKQVSKLISQGMVTKKIADELNVSPRTIESHRSHIMKKMNSSNTFDLMKKLIQINSTNKNHIEQLS